MGGKNNYFKVFVYEITTEISRIGNWMKNSELFELGRISW